ncbi:hypothetical protein WJX72_011928 [[Myrmecia] bisecta]|uniref:Protein kinase domain-containing protein n=1 Tax=[Myrmecia] bisecta TaxID=41462 RepID=A0AAW1PAW1_9CHLO
MQHVNSLGADHGPLLDCDPVPRRLYGAHSLCTAGFLTPSGTTESPTVSGLKPDFQWQPQSYTVGEGVWPGLLSALNDTSLFRACRRSRNVSITVEQVFTYMDAYQSYTGFITSYQNTVFLHRKPEEPMTLLFSGSFAPDAREPTVLRTLHYLLHKEHDMQQTHGKPARTGNPKTVVEQEAADTDAQEAKRKKEQQQAEHDERAAKRGNQASGIPLCVADLPIIDIDDLHLQDTITYTESGPVGKGRYKDIACVVKAIDLDKEDVEHYFNEAFFLDRLQNLDCVVNLVSFGRMWGGQSAYLATEYVEGRHIKADGLESEEVKASAREGLAAVHAQSDLHGDLRAANILVTPQLKVVYIDLEFASFLMDERAAAVEVQLLESLLQGRGTY